MKKSVIRAGLFLVVLLAIIALSVWYSRRNRVSPAIKTAGIVEGIEVNLSPKFQGKISEICCKEGEQVKEGQVAVRLESDDLRAAADQAAAGIETAASGIKVAEAAVENASANIRSAEADIKSAEADAERARFQMEESKRESDRAAVLFMKGFISKESSDQSRAAYDTAFAAYDSARAKVSSSVSKKEAARSQFNASVRQLASSKSLLKEAEANFAFNKSRLNDMTIPAPLSGIVIFRTLEPGEMASPGSAILTIVDMNSRFVRADLDETRIGSVALDSPAEIKVEGMPGKIFKGRVVEIGRYAEFATQRDVVGGRQDIRTFRIKIKFEDPEMQLKPGMTVEAEIMKKS